MQYQKGDKVRVINKKCKFSWASGMNPIYRKIVTIASMRTHANGDVIINFKEDGELYNYSENQLELIERKGVKQDMATIKQLITKFKEGSKKGSSASVYIQGDVLYSYGTHFPMAIRGYSTFFVNKSKYSMTTSKQQTWTRQILGDFIELTTEEMKEMI